MSGHLTKPCGLTLGRAGLFFAHIREWSKLAPRSVRGLWSESHAVPRQQAAGRSAATPPLGPCDGAAPVLLDHLGGAQQDRRGYGKTERLGGLEVHDHLEFCRKLHREIVRLLAAQDAIDIGRAATKVSTGSGP
jgi:hypothetical protein